MQVDAKVYHPVSLENFIISLTKPTAADTTVVVCTDRETFMNRLLESLNHTRDTSTSSDGARGEVSKTSMLWTKTLRSIGASRHVDFSFCHSVSHLHAYLTSLQKSPVAIRQTAAPTLILLNPINLHRVSQSLSGQSISKTFAIAVEAALDSSRVLRVIECVDHAASLSNNSSNVEANNAAMEIDQPAQLETSPPEPTQTATNPWDAEVPLLSSLSRVYGANEQEDWLTQRVKLSSVAAHWFDFESMPC